MFAPQTRAARLTALSLILALSLQTLSVYGQQTTGTQQIPPTGAVKLVDATKSNAAESEDDSWLPWSSIESLEESKPKMTAEQGAKALQKTKLWSIAGERLVYQLVAGETFDAARKQFDALAKSQPKNAQLQVKRGILLTAAAYLSENESEAYKLAGQADKLLRAATKADQENWDAWVTLATLYGYSEEAQYENMAVEILKPTIESQEQDNPQAKYAYAYTILGDVYYRQGKEQQAQATWQRGVSVYPKDAGLKYRTAEN